MSANHHYFQRYQSPDPQELAQQVQRDHEQLVQARLVQDEEMQLEVLSSLGESLTILGKEAESLPFIEEALALARKRNDQQFEIENLLHLATAQQYLNQRDLAQIHFQLALAQGRVYGVHDYDDFILHHQGRCYVEQGKKTEARACFEQALLLREAKGNQRFIDSTRRALSTLSIL